MFPKDLDQPSCDEKENSNRNHKEELRKKSKNFLKVTVKLKLLAKKQVPHHIQVTKNIDFWLPTSKNIFFLTGHKLDRVAKQFSQASVL